MIVSFNNHLHDLHLRQTAGLNSDLLSRRTKTNSVEGEKEGEETIQVGTIFTHKNNSLRTAGGGLYWILIIRLNRLSLNSFNINYVDCVV